MADCPTCRGNEILDDGSPCPDCTDYYDDERDDLGDDWDELEQHTCRYGGPAPCVDDTCHGIGGCIGWEGQP